MQNSDYQQDSFEIEKRLIKISLFFPVAILVLIWSIKAFEYLSGFSFYKLGIYPRELFGLPGILFSPFIHEDIKHLTNNSVPLFILSWSLFYFYRELSLKIILLSWLITGIWVWCGARPSYHIGASGVVYGLASFLFFSGLFRKMIGLRAISLLVIFLYGGMIWGIFPFIPDVSWESHFSGATSGLILSVYYRNAAPQPIQYDWQNEMDEDEINEMLDSMNNKT